jgi:hypothetical protein
MRKRHSVFGSFAVLLAVVTAGCPADREALDPPGGEPVDLSPDPRIEQAPAFPTPPGEVPIGLEPHPDTAPRDTVDLDTIPEPATPGTTPAPGVP